MKAIQVTLLGSVALFAALLLSPTQSQAQTPIMSIGHMETSLGHCKMLIVSDLRPSSGYRALITVTGKAPGAYGTQYNKTPIPYPATNTWYYLYGYGAVGTDIVIKIEPDYPGNILKAVYYEFRVTAENPLGSWSQLPPY